MRLLEDDGYGNLSLVKKHDNDIPRYAILSHTWGPDNEEFNFKDVTEGQGGNKISYKKIEFCRAQAASNGLKYFWVDTCASTNRAAPNSVRRSIRCFAGIEMRINATCIYLMSQRLRGMNLRSSPAMWGAALRKSRWFSRGWTLQELIAPSSVEFFSRQGDRLGNKYSLVQDIHEVTGITIEALRGAPLTAFTIEQRFSWANHRATKRQEDKAYSLLGLFDIHMPLLYGEGEKMAFVRLREEIGKSSEREGYRAEVDQPNHLVTEDPPTRLGVAEEAAFDAIGRDHVEEQGQHLMEGILVDFHSQCLWSDPILHSVVALAFLLCWDCSGVASSAMTSGRATIIEPD
jgi:hypothetical protein